MFLSTNVTTTPVQAVSSNTGHAARSSHRTTPLAPDTKRVRIGARIIFRAVYRDYDGFLLSPVALGRARILFYDDILDGGCWRVLAVEASRVHPVDRPTPLERYQALTADRAARLAGDREYYRVPCTWADSEREIEKSRRAYERAAHHVARLEALERGEQPTPLKVPGPMLALPAMWKAANAYLQLEAWRAAGRPKYQPTAEELANACKCGNDPEYCTCPADQDEPETRGHIPFSYMIAGRA